MNTKTIIVKEEAFRQMLQKMNLPLDYPDYASPEYWNKRYLSEKGQSFDWLQEYEHLRPFLAQRMGIFYDAEILHIGCGNSRFSECLYKDGFKNITNIDFSTVVIQEQMNKYIHLEEMEYVVMDATNIQYDDYCFDFIFDKGTFDCILGSTSDPVQKAHIMVENVHRILNEKGQFVVISVGHPEDRLAFFKQSKYNWNVEIFELEKPTVSHFKGYDDGEFHYMYICNKIK